MKKALQFLVILITVFFLVTVWPITKIHESVSYHNGGEVPVDIEMTSGCIAEQYFVPRHKTLESINVLIDGNGAYSFLFEIIDPNGNSIFSETVCSDGGGSFYEIPVQKNLKKGREYCMRMTYSDFSSDVIPLLKVSTNLSSLEENTLLTVNGLDTSQTSINQYTYSVTEHWLSFLIYDSFIIALALGCLMIIAKVFAD